MQSGLRHNQVMLHAEGLKQGYQGLSGYTSTPDSTYFSLQTVNSYIVEIKTFIRTASFFSKSGALSPVLFFKHGSPFWVLSYLKVLLELN